MILYHFCPSHMVDGIKKKGLTLGKFPLEPDPKKQSWATSVLIPIRVEEITVKEDWR